MAPRSRTMRAAALAALVLSLALAQSVAQSQHYESEADEDDDDGRGRAAPVDYSRYFSATPQEGDGAGDAAGFASPIDFQRLLANAQLGQGGQAVAAGSSRVQDFFRAAEAADSAIFAAPEGARGESNDTGFTSASVSFPSLFDAAAAPGAAQEGFRPADFLQVGSSEKKESSPYGPSSYSPSFTKLDADYRPQSQASYSQAAYSPEASPEGRSAPAYPKPASEYPSSYSPSAYSAAPQPEARPSPYSKPLSDYRAPAPSSYSPAAYSGGSQSESRPSPSPYTRSHSDYRSPSPSSYNPSAYSAGAQSESQPPPPPAPSHRPPPTSVPIDVYGTKSPAPPHVGKSSYPLPSPAADYTGKPKAVHDAPGRISPEYYSVPSQSSPYLPAAVAPVPRVDYNAPPAAGESYSPTNQKIQTDSAASKEKKCTKIDKTISTDDLVKGRFRRAAAMSCYVCEDPKTGGNYEECSYATEPKSAKYFIGHATSYSSDKQSKPQSYRYKRDINPYRYGYHDYDHDLYSSADSSYKYPYSNLRDHENYRFKEEDFAPTEVDYSASPSDKNCQKVQKDSMTCYVCKDPKGGSYEQCSYAVTPKENNYFVARESSFDSNDKKPYRERYRRDDKYGSSDDPSEASHDESHESSGSGHRSPREEHQSGIGLDPFLYGEPKPYERKSEKQSSASEKVDNFYAPYRSYEEYFSHLFPELVNREASASSPEEVSDGEKPAPDYQYKASIPEYFTDNEKKKDLDSVLGEFTSKDRSNCKKVQKDKMTCYQCVDDKGVQHEECMFVAASEPKSQHLAYKEVKEFNLIPRDKTAAGSSNLAITADIPGADVTPASTSDVVSAAAAAIAAATAALNKADDRSASTAVPETLKAKRDALVDEMVAAASAAAHKQQRRQAGEGPAPRRKAPAEPTPPELSELDRSPDGLYSAETRQKFDPVLKVTLPEYMLTRSEHEAIFDEVMASGR